MPLLPSQQPAVSAAETCSAAPDVTQMAATAVADVGTSTAARVARSPGIPGDLLTWHKERGAVGVNCHTATVSARVCAGTLYACGGHTHLTVQANGAELCELLTSKDCSSGGAGVLGAQRLLAATCGVPDPSQVGEGAHCTLNMLPRHCCQLM
jgi:hypothetical protein